MATVTKSQANQFEKFVDHWCPEGWRHEPFSNKLMRAFMHAVSCVEAQRGVIEGRKPVDSLKHYPETSYPEGGIGL